MADQQHPTESSTHVARAASAHQHESGLPTSIGLAYLIVPLIAYLGLARALRGKEIRSERAEQHAHRSRSIAVSLMTATGMWALALFHLHSRLALLCATLAVVGLIGARLVEEKLLATFAHITYNYLDATAWVAGAQPGSNWRYEMRWRFVKDPEYVDLVTYEMLLKHPTYRAFSDAVAKGAWPPQYSRLMRRKLWGSAFGTVEQLMRSTVLPEVIGNHGRYSSRAAPAIAYTELRQLAVHDRDLWLERWQYYWCLRNLNYIENRIRQVVSWRFECLVTFGVAASIELSSAVGGTSMSRTETLLRSVAGGTLLWSLIVCCGSSLLIVRAFRGTGTFTISYPARGTTFDPLWNQVVQVGIVCFAASFLGFGIGAPVLLDPGVLQHFALGAPFVAYSIGACSLCAVVFIFHTLGVHELMKRSRQNALDRIGRQIVTAMPDAEHARLLNYYSEVRGLREWPIRSSTIAQLAAGIALPIVVQIALLYTGLRKR
jgi:hypothetical protein